MKRFLSMLLVLLLALTLLPAAATAEDESTTVTTLEELTAAVRNGGAIVLGADITLSENLSCGKDMTLDLNGHTLDTGANRIMIYCNAELSDSDPDGTGTITGTAQFKIQVGSSSKAGSLTIQSGRVTATEQYGIGILALGTLTVNGGTITAPSYCLYDQGYVTINGGSVIANAYPAVQVKGTEKKEMLAVNGGLVESLGNGTAINLHSNCAAVINDGTVRALYENGNAGGMGVSCYKDTELTVNGGTITAYSFAVAGNGSVEGSSVGTNAKFTITDGTLVSTHDTAVYAPQVNGEVTISGGSITGARCGVEMRAGELTVTGGTITGNTEAYAMEAYVNGHTATGSAISVRQHSTKQPITVSISGGTFVGYIPFSEANPLANPAEDIAKLNYDISGGTFLSEGSETIRVKDYPNGKFVTGGAYTHNVLDYVKDGYTTVQMADELWHVVAPHYYLIGSMTEWEIDEAYELAKNEAAETEEYTIVTDLAETDQFKVVMSPDGIQKLFWYPDGMGNNYGENGEITEAGTYTVYFRPNGDGGEDWFYNCLYVAVAENTVTITLDPCNGDDPTTVAIPVGGTLSELPVPEYEDHTLIGWFLDSRTGIATGTGTQVTLETVFNEDTTIYANWYIPGDVNGDGSVNNKDVICLTRYIRYHNVEVVMAATDIDGNGTVNNKDIIRLTRYIRYIDIEIH